MRITKKIMTAALTLTTLGSAPLLADHNGPETGRTYGRVERVEHVERYERYDRHDDEWRGRRSDWVRLGTATVGCEAERNLLPVPGHDRFTAIMFRVDAGEVLLDDVKVTFGNETDYCVETRVVLRGGQRTVIVDLPLGSYGSRDIKNIRFLQRALGRGAVVQVYGLRA